MPETVYNWGREKQIKDGKGKVHKVPTQRIITEKGLKSTRIPVYHEPVKFTTISRGTYEYDPLGRA